MAISYTFVDGSMGFPPLNTTGDTTQRISLGQIVLGRDTSTAGYGIGEFIYVKFTGTIAAGDFCLFNTKAQTCVALPAAATKGTVGICMAAQATGQYGWVMIRGVHDACNIATAALTDPTALTGSATAGRATTGTASYLLEGVLARGASTANVGVAEVYWPFSAGR